MNRSLKIIYAIIILVCVAAVGLYGRHYVLEQQALQRSAAVQHATDLLDSWHGEGEILLNAKSILDEVLAENPDDYAALMQLGRFYAQEGYLHEKNVSNGKYIYSIGEFAPGSLINAINVTGKSVATNPKYADGYIYLGYLYLQMPQIDLARSALENAERLGTSNPRLDLNYGLLFDALGKPEDAAARYKKVESSGAKNKKILSGANTKLIGYYIDRGEYEEANLLYKKNMEMDPGNAWAREGYSDFARKYLGDFDAAIKYAREALAIMDYGMGRTTLALALYRDWANSIVSKKVTSSDVQALYDEAYALYPKLNEVMVYEGSFPKTGDLVKVLKERGVSIDAVVDDGSTALIVASNTGRVDAVKTLLALGANPNIVAKTGWTALLGAADSGYQDIVSVLLANGADPAQKLGESDAAMLAYSHGYAELAKLIRAHTKPPKA